GFKSKYLLREDTSKRIRFEVSLSRTMHRARKIRCTRSTGAVFITTICTVVPKRSVNSASSRNGCPTSVEGGVCLYRTPTSTSLTDRAEPEAWLPNRYTVHTSDRSR